MTRPGTLSSPVHPPFRRRAAAVTVAALTAGLALSAPAHGVVAGGPAPSADRPAAAPGTATAVHEVTLITGDVVKLSVDAQGRYDVRVTPARRAGGGVVRHLTQIGPDGVYVVPSDAAPLVQAGVVDRELFHVSYLVEHGLADDGSDTLPLIVSYAPPSPAARGDAADAADAVDAVDAPRLAGRADDLPGVTGAVGLPSVNGAGVSLDKEHAADAWRVLSPGGGAASGGGGVAARTGHAAASTLGGGVARVWLDRVAEVLLDESVPLVGAPRAWQAGYDGTGTTVAVLDTGVDPDHPDLAGRVAAMESFVEGEPARDTNGHGTHVASTIAGTGAASDGRYRGVAPGATLVSGRVCGAAGCPYSSIIAGMEWAAVTMDADIVSMSLGAGPSDGTDPLSLAVDQLTASTGALFVAAAGNNGMPRTVTAPAAADSALAVAATDKHDGMAWFSSRGPRHWDMALKPDIAAPGVEIVAARAEGTGDPSGGWYTTLSGTSMSTPHVSAAAAILAQRFPHWRARELKAALMSTATDAGHTVYDQGAGRLDLARAAIQEVFACTANLDFGIVELPRDGEPEPAPLTRTVTYTNTGDEPVTLTLATSLAGTGGEPVPDGALASDATVTVPAGGSATAEVTLDVTGIGPGWYGGSVVATDEATGTRVTVPVGLVREVPTFELTIHTLGRDGRHLDAGHTVMIELSGDGTPVVDMTTVDVGVTAVRAPAGTYHLVQLAGWVGDDSRRNLAWLVEPELTLDRDMEITLDARTASEVSFTTPEPAEPLSHDTGSFLQRTTDSGQPYVSLALDQAWTRQWATPTAQVTRGGLRFATQWMLGESGVDMSVRGPAKLALHPATPLNVRTAGGRMHGDFGYVPFEGRRDLRVVDVGTGTPADLAGADLAGALALLEVDLVARPSGNLCGLDVRLLEALREAGAAGVVGFPSPHTACTIPMEVIGDPGSGGPVDLGIPHAYLPTAEGLALRERLAAGPVTVRVTGTPDTPHVNVLKPYEDGRIPDSLHYDLTRDDLAVFDVDLHAPSPQTEIYQLRYVWKAGDAIPLPVAALGPVSVGPAHLREYVGPVGEDVFHLRDVWTGDWPDADERQRVGAPLDAPVRVREPWFTRPQTPGPAVASDAAYGLVDPDRPPAWADASPVYCALCWEGTMLAGLAYLVSGAPGDLQHDNLSRSLTGVAYRLYRDGKEIPVTPMGAVPTFVLPGGVARYRLEYEDDRNQTVWTWTSGPPAEGARQLGYRCVGRDLLHLHDDPCGPVPAVFVSYDAGDSVADDNTVRAPGGQVIDVYAFHHPSPYPMPEIAGLDLWVSYGDGEWSPVRVSPAGDGRFRAVLVHPPASRRPSDRVDLKVHAWDADGNRVEQVTRGAFTLVDRTDPPGVR